MTQRSHDDVRAYYADLHSAAELGAVARILLGDRITEESARLLKGNCPNHASVSGTSLHIELDKQLWRCWGCGISGDVLQLVEFVQSGTVTAGVAGEMTASHREARDWLAEHVGLPKLSHMGLSAEEVAAVERRECSLRRARQVLMTAAAWYHERLLANAEAMAWVQAQYGFTEEVVRQFQIGYADLHGLRAHLYDQQFTAEELLGSGLFLPNDAGHEDQVLPFFAQRLIFPYHCHGQIVYFIGRQTPWTENNKYEDKRKYKKLFAHDPVKYPWIVEGIANDHLYNEDLLSSRPSTVVITEGITDCIALLAQGFPAISPVTVKFRHEDTDRLLARLRGVEEVIICQDNEISQAGWQGAFDTAQRLQEAGIPCRIAVLPLGEIQEQARGELRERFHITGPVTSTPPDTMLTECPDTDRQDAQRLIEQAKIDVCQFFRDGGTAEDFRAVMRSALSPLDLAIAELSATTPLHDQQTAVEGILRQIARQPLLLQTALLKAMRERLGNAIGMTELRRMLKAAEQGTQADIRDQQRRQATTPTTEGELVCDDGQRRLSLVNNGILRETVRETAQGPVVTRATICNCHVRLTRDVVTVEPADMQEGTSFTKREFFGRLVGDTWEESFKIDAMKWPLNTDLASHIAKAGGTAVLLETGPYLDDIRRVAFHLSTDIEHSTIYRMFGFHPTEGFISPTLTIRDGEIVPSASRNIIVDTSSQYNKAQNLDLAPATVEEVREVIRHLLTEYLRIRPYQVTLPIFAHAFAGPVLFGSPLLEVGYTPFILFIGGSSGKGKTETARLAQCLWGEFPTKER
ncbi:MAG TPA: CHC2 zinc finger domain-containing protein, partial [Armatimonadota bacterium]